jgi:hypothetical protein
MCIWPIIENDFILMPYFGDKISAAALLQNTQPKASS